MDEENELSKIGADLYFLIYKFLSGGPLKKTLQTFHEELEQCKILPKRTDWLGDNHDRTVEDMIYQFPHVRPDYLLELCCRAGLNPATTSGAVDNKVGTLFSLKKNASNNVKQLCDYVKRLHLVPPRNLNDTCNIANIIRGREISGPFARRWLVSPRLYNHLQFQRRTLGHLSAVYCLLFDHSGHYIITGADDLLIKLWSSHTGRLINTFRGASSEITDIAINLENTLLAAGSIDRILRIWDLQSGAPVAVLTGHSGIITSVNFCPSPSWNLQYLVTTSGDGSVAFWAYSYDTGGKVDFRNKPTMYQEKMRPGQAQMICSSFSPGGVFLATGSADHHVRVYYMKGDEGPHRILETEAHNDRVDSIQWAHSGLRFLSGSKDGVAIIWSFESQQWKNTYLHMTTKLTNTKKVSEDTKKLKVTMVAWNQSDSWAITAVSDHTLKIWNARSGQLFKVLSGHTDEIYVLEAHPHDRHVILSAGHDGQLFIWDIIKGEIMSRFVNTIENQGYGAIFDAKWSPDGNAMAASDSHGHMLIFGFGNGSNLYEQLPKELFFHTDYRPLVRDANNYVLDEQTQIAPHLMPPPFLVDIDGNPYPPMLQRLVPGREHCKTEQLVPSIVIGNEGTQEVIQVVVEEHARLDNERLANPNIEDLRGSSYVSRSGGRRIRDAEGIRQSTGDWQRDPNMKWKKYTLVHPLSKNHIKKVQDYVDEMEQFEKDEYHRQLSKRPHMITTSTINESASKLAEKKKNSAHANKSTKALKPKAPFQPLIVMLSDSEVESHYSESSGYSDWVAEEDVRRPIKRTRRTQANYNSESDGGRNDESDEGSEEERSPSPAPPPPPPRETSTRMNHVNKEIVPEIYKTSEWLTEVRPRKSPYFPQMGDELVYFIQGHNLYLDAIRTKKVYEVNNKTLPWTKNQLRSYEFVKVLGIQYEIKPPRLCNLKLALLDDEGRLTGKIITVKYHDMPDVLDFFVLKQNFEVAMSRNWKVGDKFRCIIDDSWWVGEIVSISTTSETDSVSPFLCYEIKWDNGELERMSPWDMEPLDNNRIPENLGEALPVLETELENIMYQPGSFDWPNNDRASVTKNILSGLSKVMELAIAEPFLVPVDFNVYPTYAMVIEYPIDLSTIKARFENHFYRRIISAQFDIKHLAANAEKFNERHSDIVKHARVLTELCLRIVKQCTTNLDVTAIYHQLLNAYDSSDTEVDVEIGPSSSRMLRSLPARYLRCPDDWKTEAKLLFEAIWDCEDSIPFRTPVNQQKYTDYNQVIQHPMDLGTIKEKLHNNMYQTPNDFYNDMKLIIQNSKTYNTDVRSRIFVMTVRLAAIFDEHITKIIRNWKNAKRRTNAHQSTASKRESATSSCTSSSASDVSVIDEPNGSKQNYLNPEEGESSDSDSEDEDNQPLKRLQNTRVSKPPKPSPKDDSSSSSSSPSTKVNEDSDNSEESYKPSTRSTRKRNRLSSSSDDVSSDDNSDDDDDDRPLSTQVTRQNRRTKAIRVSGRKTKRKRLTDSDDDSDEESSSSDSDREKAAGDSSFFTSVSSRGRVRKLNPRVRALIKN